MSEELTDDERSYLTRMFWKSHDDTQKKLQQELLILSKYKAELARGFEQSGAYQNTLISCMKDIIRNQEELQAVMLDLIKCITGKYPEYAGRVTAEEDLLDE